MVLEGAEMTTKKKKPATKKPSAKVKQEAEKKALNWKQKKSLVKPAKVLLELPEELAMICIGRIVAIEYEDDKYDGKKRIWRHEFTKNRKLHISKDGQIWAIVPKPKITKRGIEG